MKSKSKAPGLQQQLTLAAWFADALGFGNNAEMLRGVKDADENWSGGGCHPVLALIRARSNKMNAATWGVLEMLDSQIQEDWHSLNRERQTPVTPKYFQYLASLSSAYFLWKLTQEGADAMLKELRDFIYRQDDRRFVRFDDVDEINKLAFWVATGGGKTLLLHVHYRQFLRHKNALFEPDNILLVTPNETLSRQHLEEMKSSGIPCFRHGERDLLLQTPNAVRIIEITKLTGEEEKRKSKKGESVPVEAFSGRNLVFVDEGHKGTGGEEWFKRRDQLTQNGFTFEYSATFGQALAAAKNNERTREYARAILFDYSYPYFYNDGYGKDYDVRNIEKEKFPDMDSAAAAPAHDTMMLGNLLSFFQQQWAYETREISEWSPYMVEKPLLLLLGATVAGDEKSDMARIIAFLHRVSSDQKRQGGQQTPWLEEAVDKILSGRSEITTPNGADFFAGRFEFLQNAFPAANKKTNVAELCQKMRKTLFHSESPGPLCCNLISQGKNGDAGELCLRVGANRPFGLVYVGNCKTLYKAAEKIPGMEANVNKMQKPLFADVHLSDSPVNILIGAKKFMEGWSSWRVCGMGLLNVGRSEGALIIQLFGRGVRLRGKDFSLKRSAALLRESKIESPPENLRLLETLNIFAIRAKFMEKFREYIENEGVTEEFPFQTRIEEKIRQEGIRMGLAKLLPPPAEKFDKTVWFAVSDDIKKPVVLDMTLRAQAMRGGAQTTARVETDDEYFDDEILDMLDFDWLYRALLKDKRDGKRYNLILRREELRGVLENKCAVRGAGALKIKNYEDLRQVRQYALFALRKYADRLYYAKLRQWQTANQKAAPLFVPETEGKEIAPNYNIVVNTKDKDKIKRIQDLLKDENAMYNADANDELPRLVFDRHIYAPLLLQRVDNEIMLSPRGLNRGEEKFIKTLRQYCNGDNLREGQSIFVCRNESRGRGVGFFHETGFYPDFLLWVYKGGKQRLVFVEPHGMLLGADDTEEYKAQIWKEMRKWTRQIRDEGEEWKQLTLDSYIISQTPISELIRKRMYHKWSKEKFADHHILFVQDREEAIRHIIETEPPQNGG